MTPMPMHRYVLTSMEQERRTQAVRAILPMAAYIVLIVTVSVLSFNLVTARHQIAKLEETCR